MILSFAKFQAQNKADMIEANTWANTIDNGCKPMLATNSYKFGASRQMEQPNKAFFTSEAFVSKTSPSDDSGRLQPNAQISSMAVIGWIQCHPHNFRERTRHTRKTHTRSDHAQITPDALTLPCPPAILLTMRLQYSRLYGYIIVLSYNCFII